MVFYCCVPKCTNNNAQITMRKFPKSPEFFLKWISAIKRQDLLLRDEEHVRRNFKVCDEHFPPTARFTMNQNRSNLKVGSIPLLKLPGASEGDESMKSQELPTSSAYEENISANKPENSTEADTSTKTLTSSALSSSDKTPCSDDVHARNLTKKLKLLAEVKVTRQKQLSPESLKLYRIANTLKRKSQRLQAKNTSNRRHIKEAIQFAESGELFKARLNKTSFQFLKMQLKQQNVKGQGRRFSMEDKLFALSLMKTSHRAYKLLRKTFVLPSRKTLTSMLNCIPFNCGINPHIMEALRHSVEEMQSLDRYCCLLFDEMAIEPSLSYNKREDLIIGFTDSGSGNRSTNFADHVLVFMARGIHRKWKQPVAYYFTCGGLNAYDIVMIIKNVIRALLNINLKVIATVCDQMSANVKAINILMDETNAIFLRDGRENHLQGFLVDDREIVPLYDSPHLLKGIRNNMLEKNVQFIWKKNIQMASWTDVIKLYELDIGDHDTRVLNKLTDGHIYKEKMKKMKVNMAAQIFSHRVSSTMATHSASALPPSAVDTADFLLFMDKLFDSLNGASIKPEHGKTLRCAITASSSHVAFWTECLKVLNSLQFIRGTKKTIPPSVHNLKKTIQGFMYLWHRLHLCGFKYLCTRNFNQDPLENYFSCVRSHGWRNINPTCSFFTQSFKSLLIQQLITPHSPGANCEKDDCDGMLNSLKHFLQPGNCSNVIDIADNTKVSEAVDVIPVESIAYTPPLLNAHSYIAGYMARKILKKLGKCELCKNELVASDTEDEVIKVRNYTVGALTMPNTNFVKLFSQCSNILHFYLPRLSATLNIKTKLLNKLKSLINITFKPCETHNLFLIFCNLFVQFYILMWTKNICRILKGLDCRNMNDEVKRKALHYYNSHRTKNNKIKELKML